MGQKQKLLLRLKSNPKDFTFEEAEALLHHLGFRRSNKGKTSGSRVSFINEASGAKIILHRPHPDNILHNYQIRQLINFFIQEDLL